MATGVKIPAFILKATIELYRHSGMVLAGDKRRLRFRMECVASFWIEV